MNLQRIKLTNFRNHHRIDINLDQLTLIVGPNSSGKTNILESIWLLAVGKIQRGSEEAEVVNFGADFAKVEGRLNNDLQLEVRLQINDRYFTKKFFINGVWKRLTDYIGNLKVVMFAPTDLDLVCDSPGTRRDYLDTTLSQINSDYRRVTVSYDRALKARNKLLLSILQKRARREELRFWDETLIKLGTYITHKRQDLFVFLNNVKSEFGDFSWQYRPNLITVDRLSASFAKDLQTTVTNVGPHRDEFRFYLGKNDLNFYGSRGEQRIAVLALKLAELEFMSLKTQTRPMLLLDDIFSELDREHREIVLSVIEGQQTIITSADKESIPKEIFKKAKLIAL